MFEKTLHAKTATIDGICGTVAFSREVTINFWENRSWFARMVQWFAYQLMRL